MKRRVGRSSPRDSRGAGIFCVGDEEDDRDPPGDVVWFQPGEKHWHGASATAAMQHLAIQEALDGRMVEWLEQVSDQQYGDYAPR